MPEQSLEDRLRENQNKAVASGDFMALEDLSDSDNEDQNQKTTAGPSCNLNSSKDLTKNPHLASSKTMNSRAQLIEKSLSNNANLVKVMDQKLFNNRSGIKQ